LSLNWVEVTKQQSVERDVSQSIETKNNGNFTFIFGNKLYRCSGKGQGLGKAGFGGEYRSSHYQLPPFLENHKRRAPARANVPNYQ